VKKQIFHYVPVANLIHRSGGADGHKMPSYTPPSHPLLSKKLKFNLPKFSTVPMMMMDDDDDDDTIIENVHVITRNHYLQNTEIKSKILT
jgi:hypothetical protein